jgi:hypothetical protein
MLSQTPFFPAFQILNERAAKELEQFQMRNSKLQQENEQHSLACEQLSQENQQKALELKVNPGAMSVPCVSFLITVNRGLPLWLEPLVGQTMLALLSALVHLRQVQSFSDCCMPEADSLVPSVLLYKVANLIIDWMLMQMPYKASSDAHFYN